MLKPINTVVFLFLLLPGSISVAQENLSGVARIGNNSEDVQAGARSNVHADVERKDRTLRQAQGPEARMSPLETQISALDSRSELVEQAGNTVMAAGSCTVIDQFVRQYCVSNPNDISCQFQ